MPELVFDAIAEQSAEVVPIPDTGDFGEDLIIFAKEVVAANIGSEGGARRSRSIVAAAATSDRLTAAMRSFWAARLANSAIIIERANERKELPPDADPNLIIESLIGPLWVRLLLTGEPVTDELADRVAGLVAAGATRMGAPSS